MAKSTIKSKHTKIEAIKSDNDTIIVFIQDDTCYPSKISSIRLSKKDVCNFIEILNDKIS